MVLLVTRFQQLVSFRKNQDKSVVIIPFCDKYVNTPLPTVIWQPVAAKLGNDNPRLSNSVPNPETPFCYLMFGILRALPFTGELVVKMPWAGWLMFSPANQHIKHLVLYFIGSANSYAGNLFFA